MPKNNSSSLVQNSDNQEYTWKKNSNITNKYAFPWHKNNEQKSNCINSNNNSKIEDKNDQKSNCINNNNNSKIEDKSDQKSNCINNNNNSKIEDKSDQKSNCINNNNNSKIEDKNDQKSNCINNNNNSKIEIMKMLDHPNVLKAVDIIYNDKNSPSILYEKCPTDLKQAIQNRKFSKVQLVYSIFQIAEGMKYIHSRKIIHLNY